MNNCFMDTIRKTTDLDDNYGKIQNIIPLQICNTSNNYRIPENTINNSVLLQEAGINSEDVRKVTNKSFNDCIYERNLPFGRVNEKFDTPFIKQSRNSGNNSKLSNTKLNNTKLNNTKLNNTKLNNDRKLVKNNLKLKVESRPVLSGLFINPKAIEERNMLDQENLYVPTQTNICNDMTYVPGKGPIDGYFDYIDVESQLKNINEIDTKCSEQFFKNPPSGKNKIGCYTDVFVKDYKKSEKNYGYKWCDYTDGIQFADFPLCKPETNLGNNTINNTINNNTINNNTINNNTINNNTINNNINNNKLKQSGQVINQNELNQVTRDLNLSQQKQALDILINQKRNENDMIIERKNIIQYKPKGIQNIYSPTIIKRKLNEDLGNLMGRRAAIENQINLSIKDKLNTNQVNNEVNNEVNNQVNNRRNNQVNKVKQEVNCIRGLDNQSRLTNFDYKDDTKQLYNLKTFMNGKESCFCEQLFNNSTKRKIIVPNDPRFN